MTTRLHDRASPSLQFCLKFPLLSLRSKHSWAMGWWSMLVYTVRYLSQTILAGAEIFLYLEFWDRNFLLDVTKWAVLLLWYSNNGLPTLSDKLTRTTGHYRVLAHTRRCYVSMLEWEESEQFSTLNPNLGRSIYQWIDTQTVLNFFIFVSIAVMGRRLGTGTVQQSNKISSKNIKLHHTETLWQIKLYLDNITVYI